MDYGDVLSPATLLPDGTQQPLLWEEEVTGKQLDGPDIEVWELAPASVVCRIRGTDAQWASIEANPEHVVLFRAPQPLDEEGNEIDMVMT